MTQLLTYSKPKYYLGIFIPLLFCGIICLAYRPSDTLGHVVFEQWFTIDFSNSIPLNNIVIYNLPAALWVFSMTLFSYGLSVKIKQSTIRLIYVPILFVIVLELLQILNLTDGTFDLIDIILPILGYIFAILLLKFNTKTLQKKSSYKLKGIVYPFIFALVLLADLI